MQSLLDPAVLFFALGAFAGLVRSNLEMPAAISKFLSIYLLTALGLKGGFALAASGFTASVASSLGLAVLLAVVVPLVGYALLRRVLSGFNAAAVAATYGSVSAVTFVTATQYLESQSISYGGYMAAAMALMESPAILLAVMLANALRQRQAVPAAHAAQAVPAAHAAPVMAVSPSGAAALAGPGGLGAAGPTPAGKAGPALSVGKILRESFTDGTQLLLLGAMLIGLITGDAGKAAMQPFSGDLFKGMLCLFLLDMGLSAARNLPAVRKQSPWLLAYAVWGPLVHAS
ncbi:MAG: sodium-dependent bicarbonate transport family permease, partial [Acidovorax sp.]